MDGIELHEINNSSTRRDRKYDARTNINNNIISNNNNEILKGDVWIGQGPVSHEAPEIVFLDSGFSPGFCYSLSCILAVLFFMAAFEFPGLPALPYPLMGNILPASCLNDVEEMAIVLLGMFGFHFLRRFSEILFIHRYNQPITCIEAIGANIYYTFWGFFVGWSINFHLGYKTPHPAFLYIGVAIFCAGEIGNFISHLSLRRQVDMYNHKSPLTGHIIPKGFMFQYVSMPHYFFEIISWLGFALSAFTLPSFLFLIVSIVVMLHRGYKKHLSYLEEFSGKENTPVYPPSRKAVIPFLI